MTSAFPHLFSPIRLGSQDMRNRIMRTATTTNLGEGGKAGEAMIEFYRVLARGGVGAIVTESFQVHNSPGIVPTALNLYDSSGLPSVRSLTDVVHAEDSLLIAQIYHGGRQHLSRKPQTLMGPSPVACPYSGGIPHAMTDPEIYEMIESFVSGAANAIDSGVDGIEIHGGQGHLIQAFLSPFSNVRTDAWGGSFERRLRFAREIIERVRYRIGPEAVLGYRMGIEEFTPGGLTIDDSERVARIFESDGFLDYVSLTQGNFNTLETHLPDRHYPQVTYVDIQKRIKRAAPSLLVVATTRIHTPDQAEAIIEAGSADIVGLTRALIVDPDWPAKARSGRQDTIRRCISCNHCWDTIIDGGPIRCATNPVCGQELVFPKIVRNARKRSVLVVGGGPAGLETARVAALRGHSVTLLEQRDRLGGKILEAATAPAHEEMQNVLDFLVPQVEAAGVDIRLGTRATAASILSAQPEVAVIATGAKPIAPTLDGDGSVPVLAPTAHIDTTHLPGNHLVVMDEDGYWWGAAVARIAAGTGMKVTVVSRYFEVFRELPQISRITTLRKLDELGVNVLPNMEVCGVRNGKVILKHYRSGRKREIGNAAAVLWVGMQTANDGLVNDLRKRRFRNYRLIGDAYSPRRLPIALSEAQRVARQI
jgi:2,4-dienoyl-CoA reductase-like NADH-dependent reductase (Old Yellow Enzyme family)